MNLRNIIMNIFIYTSVFCFAQEQNEFNISNSRVSIDVSNKPDINTIKKHFEDVLKRKDLRPVEEFLARSELATHALNERDFDGAIRNATKAITIASIHENEMTGLLRVLYLQNLRHLYECENWREMLGQDADTLKAYINILQVFERHNSWKDKHTAEYLAVLVGLEGLMKTNEEKEYYMDRIIAEVPSAQTIPMWIYKRYEFDIIDDWENTSERIRMIMNQYDEYPYKIMLYELMARGYARQGKTVNAIKMLEDGLNHVKKPFSHLMESEREYFLSGQLMDNTIYSMKNQCATLYIEMGKWDDARRILTEIMENADEGSDIESTKKLLDFIDNNPPGTELPRGRAHTRLQRAQ